METTNSLCPRCQVELTTHGDLHPVDSCRQCGGSLIAAGNLTPLLDAVAEQLFQHEDPAEAVIEIADKQATIACPCCDSPMENYGYLQRKEVFIDSCLRCLVFWVDGTELTVMAALRAMSMADHRQHHVEMTKRERELDEEWLVMLAKARRRVARRYC